MTLNWTLHNFCPLKSKGCSRLPRPSPSLYLFFAPMPFLLFSNSLVSCSPPVKYGTAVRLLEWKGSFRYFRSVHIGPKTISPRLGKCFFALTAYQNKLLMHPFCLFAPVLHIAHLIWIFPIILFLPVSFTFPPPLILFLFIFFSLMTRADIPPFSRAGGVFSNISVLHYL